MIHRVSFNDDNTLQLALHAPLEEDLDDWHLVQLWVWEMADWEVVSTLNSFHVDAKYDSVLVKLPGVTCTPGFGRELWTTEAGDEQPEGFGEQALLVTEEVRVRLWLIHRTHRLPDHVASTRSRARLLRPGTEHPVFQSDPHGRQPQRRRSGER